MHWTEEIWIGVKCTSKNKRKHSGTGTAVLLCTGVIAAAALLILAMLYYRTNYDFTAKYEKAHYSGNIYQGSMFASDLCVASENVALDGFSDDEELHGAGLFEVNEGRVVYGYNMFERLYPASTTKLLTAYVALKYGNPSDVVTISEHAVDFEWDEVTCGLEAGDQVTLYDLLCGLLLQSGNDCGTAIAEHIAGSEEAFADLMNSEARALGATGSHFLNPHGLHDENHYTTVYDLYLIFNACIKDSRFMDIISMQIYTGTMTSSDGTVRTNLWSATNYYSAELAEAPQGVRVFGGKTGTTDEAGSCVILYNEDFSENPYISIIMGAPDKEQLYEEMNRLLEAGMTKN